MTRLPDDPSVLLEIPAGTFVDDGAMMAWGDKTAIYAIQYPDGRIVVADARLETRKETNDRPATFSWQRLQALLRK